MIYTNRKTSKGSLLPEGVSSYKYIQICKDVPKRGSSSIFEKSIEKDFETRLGIIADSLEKIKEHDAARIQNIRDRIKKNLEEVVGKEKVDNNRFEQELIYYIEKLDINEEKVRLKTHLDYFIKTMKEPAGGRKLNFIGQEIGREVNTIGSKANDAEMQKLVVLMKDELEKIKEQTNNVL